MTKHREARLRGRERARLRVARENGFLNARSPDNQHLVEAFSEWCWRLRLPMVWLERRTPHSRYGHIRLDMFTTPNMLTETGQAKMCALGASRVSAHDAHWDRVPLEELERLTNAVFRAVTRLENYEANRSPLVVNLYRESAEQSFAVA